MSLTPTVTHQSLPGKQNRIYLDDAKRLGYFNQKANPEFWDKHWEIDNLRDYILNCQDDAVFIPALRQFLPSGSTVLEGGCGRGQLVHALKHHGYQAIGIDYAQQTIEKIERAVPELDVRLGDVRALPIEDATLDGYISVGVIEHFWEGYESILKEMKRTLKPGGLLLISFPYMSPLRRFKAAIRAYPVSLRDELDDRVDRFYQFALDAKRVVRDLEALGFSCKEIRPFDGIKGFKDELTWFKPLLQPIYDRQKLTRIRSHLNKLLQPFASHSVLLIMEKSCV